MKVETAADGSIAIEDRFVFLRTGLLISAALFLGLAAIQLLSGMEPARAAGISFLLALGCGAFAAAVEDSAFEFDAEAREVRWMKRRLIGARRGTIPFADIDD